MTSRIYGINGTFALYGISGAHIAALYAYINEGDRIKAVNRIW
jgi:hypothetical protein